jgi:hypothetical protein
VIGVLYTIVVVSVFVAIPILIVWEFVNGIQLEKNRKGIYDFNAGQKSPNGGLVRVEGELEESAEQAIAVVNDWALMQGFLSIGSFWARFPDNPELLMSVWEDPDGTFLSHYYFDNKKLGSINCCDFVSILRLNSRVSFSSSSSTDGNLTPLRKGVIKQSFPFVNIDQLYANHNQGLVFLENAIKLKPFQLEEPISEFITQCVRDEAGFVSSHFLWKIRIFIWYFRRKRYDGVPVWDRFANITPADLPN